MTSRREELHRALDAFCDAEERAVGINDPQLAVQAREEAFASMQQLIKLVAIDAISMRIGAARAGRHPLEIPFGSEQKAQEVAGLLVPEPDDMLADNREVNRATREMLVRFLLDFAFLLPENFAHTFAISLCIMNLGGETPLLTPYSIQGLGPAKNAVIQTVWISRVYYFWGFCGGRKEAIIDALNQNNPFEDYPLTDVTIRSWISDRKLSKLAAEMKEQGRLDREAGKRPSVPLAADLPLAMYELLTGNTRTQM